MSIGRVDYDERLHSVFARGRALPQETMDTWMATFARYVRAARPLDVLDLGSGTGRFSPYLAETFGGPVYAVEPSEKMISAAITQAVDPNVHYIRGTAEAIPLRDSSIDVALLYFVLHHIADKDLGAAELSRVLRPDATLFIRTNFSDRIPDILWHQFCPSAREVEASMFQSVAEVTQLFEECGFAVVALEEIEFMEARNKKELLERLRLKALSTFEFLDEQEVEEGFQAMQEAIDQEPDSEPVLTRGDLLVLNRR